MNSPDGPHIIKGVLKSRRQAEEESQREMIMKKGRVNALCKEPDFPLLAFK